MNSLSLRMAIVKIGENVKKNAEMRADIVALPMHYQSSEDVYCIQFKKAKTIPEQVIAVKNTFKNLKGDLQALQFLADLFFYSPLKHPVKNQILKLLKAASILDANGIDETSIVAALACSVQRLVEETKSQTESSVFNVTIASLSSCLENFNCALNALCESVSTVFPFLCASVQKFLTELSVLTSLSLRNEYYNYVHNSVRFTLSCVQHFPTKLKNEHPKLFEKLNSLCGEIILDKEMPMDICVNAGILLALNAKVFIEYEAFVKRAKLTKIINEIALCAGVVNTFNQDDFEQFSADIRDVCTKIVEIANANAIVPHILLCAARALHHVSKRILSFDLQTKSVAENTKLILMKLLTFTFSYLEHHMDSVRHLCRELARNIILATKKIKFNTLMQKVYESCNFGNHSISLQCVLLQQTSLVLGANEIIENCPGLFANLFATHLGHDFIVNNLFDVLMSTSHVEFDYDVWFETWIEYLLHIAIINDARLPEIENLIEKAVKYEPKIVQRIIDHENADIPISTKLSALWVVRKFGLKMDNFNDVLEKFSKHLLFSILSNSDETRIKALRLLVETHKTTEMISAMECKLLITYLEFNSNCQHPSTRHKTLRLLSKALMRCESNLARVLKDQKLTEKKSSSLQPQSPSLYLKFLNDFINILVSNLFKGANFTRRSISLQLLEQCLQIYIKCDLNFDMLPKTTVFAVVDMLADSYEANKKYAVDILKLIEDEMDCSLIQQYQINIDLVQMLALLKSVRPSDSLTATYQLELYCNRSAVNDTFGDYDLPTYNPTYYGALSWLLLELKEGLKMAKRSILQAAKLNPLYGILLATKHLLKHLDFQILAQEMFWRILIGELIILCKELTMVVAPVVNSSSPEGHLPNDFSDLPAELVENNEESTTTEYQNSNCKILAARAEILDLNNIKTTPQMVLLCAWRTVKEVSLILGEIVLRSPIQFNQLADQFLVTKEQILVIGEHFKQLLSETKHRGAFEQAYVGFSKLCCRLWRVEMPDLHSLPMQWLRELIDLISKDEQINEKICSTRRSAGVPFMVQALITSELQVGSTKSLTYCMSSLLLLCANQNRSADSRTHALNIVRALFRCTDLNEVVGEYVAEGIKCAIRGYDADTWSEKNSATLLFAALITRIFGVQLTKDTEKLNIRNKMTGRIFFLRYPQLYDFFLQQLQRASKLIMQHQRAQNLHPLLLILSRLYPSALEGTESNFKTSEFIPYILDCAGCPEMQTRYLAAKAVTALISKDAVPTTILNHLRDIYLTKTRSCYNALHAKLLQIFSLIKTYNCVDEPMISDICVTFTNLHTTTQGKNPVISTVILDIFNEILKCLSSFPLGEYIQNNLLYFSELKDFRTNYACYYYPVLYKSACIYNLHILRLTQPFGAISDYLLTQPDTYEVVKLEDLETNLNIILIILLQTGSTADLADDLYEFAFSQFEVDFVNALDCNTLIQIGDKLRKSKELHNTLKRIVQKPLYYPECAMKAYAILSFLDHFDYTLSHLILESKKYPGDVKSPLSMCVERAVLNHGIVDWEISQLCLEYLLEIAKPWHPYCLRLKASKILAYIAGHYHDAIKNENLSFIRLYISLILSLLMDDDYDIRNYIADTILHNLNDDTEMRNVVSTMAQRLFLQSTADILLNIKADDNYILEIFKIITECLTSANVSLCSSFPSTGACTDLEVFDKNETNEFAEPMKAISDAIIIYRNTFSERKIVLDYINEYKV